MKQKFRMLASIMGASLAISAVFVPMATSSSASTLTAAQGLAAAKKFVTQYVNPVTSIGLNVPLKTTPPKGKKLFWLQGNEASTALMTPGMQAAAKALGWKETTIITDPTNPASINSAMMQAISEGANYIAVSGQPQANYQAALTVAKSKHIPVFTSYSTETPQGKANGLYSDVGGIKQWQLFGQIMGNYAIVDSGGTANLLFVSLSEYAVLAAQGPVMQQTFANNCPGCTFASVDTTVADLVAGNIPSIIVNYLVSHPSVNYVYIASGFMTAGLQAAMQTAGLKNITILETNPQTPNLQAIATGFEKAGVGLPTAMSSWYIVDAMARYSENMSEAPNWTAGLPAQIITKFNIPNNGNVYDGPGNFAAQFKKLWKVK